MTLTTQLATLESSGLIRVAQLPPELEYLFRHALVQEAAYGSLLKQHRRALHQAIGDTLERTYPDRLDALAPVLAHHFDEAEDTARALDYFVRAGDLAARKFATAESLMHYTRALELAPRADMAGEPLTHLYSARGRALEMSGQYAEALANYQAMESLARERGDRAMELAALMARATIRSAPTALFAAAEAQALSEQAITMAREMGDRRAEAKILWNLVLLNKFIGGYDAVVAYGEQSAAIARELNLREQLAFTLNDMAPGYLARGDVARGQATLVEAERLWRELGNLPMLADSLSNRAEIGWLIGEFEQSLALSREAYAISRSLANLWGQSYSLGSVGVVLLERGEVAEAIRVIEESIRLGEQAGFAVSQVVPRAILALVYGQLGDVARGFELARLALAKADELLPLFRSIALLSMASLWLCDQRMAEAEQAIRDAYQSLGEGDMFTAPLLAAVDCAVSLANGDPTHALDVAERTIAQCRAHAIRTPLPELLYFRGMALHALGHADDARTALHDARTEAHAIGTKRSLLPILVALNDHAAQRGDADEADALRAEARAVIAFIAAHCPPNLRTKFLALPDLRHMTSDK